MKHFTVLLLFILPILAYSQYDKCTILFKNNTSKEGFVKVRAHDGLKFKENEEDKPIVYNHRQVIGFNIGEKEYRYIQHNPSDTEPRILLKIILGKVSLYAEEFQGGQSSMSVGPGSIPVQVYREPSTEYYMYKNQRLIKIGKKLKKRHLKKLKDCPELIKKIKNNEIHKTNIITAIEFYNENCG